MNAKNIYAALTALIGLGLIVAGYLILGESLDTNIKILDILVTIFMFMQLYQLVLFPWIQGVRTFHGGSGRMGKHFMGLHLCATVSILIIVLGILFHFPFKYQLLTQILVLIFVIAGRSAALRLGEKMIQEYQDEGLIQSESLTLGDAFEDLLKTVAVSKKIDERYVQQLREMRDAAVTMSPSSHKVSKLLDHQLVLAIADLKASLQKGDYNKERAERDVSFIGLLLARRKNYKL